MSRISRVADFLNPYKLYIFIGAGLFVLGLIATIYVQSLKIDKYKEKAKNGDLSLSISNASIDSLTAELNKTRDAWTAKANEDAKRKKELADLLKGAEEENLELLTLSKKLNANKTGNTPIPKDIIDAWKQL